jgi:predicted RNase H-like nuclease (RuvC/YqgF family)
MKNAIESHSSRLEQVEDRISGLKDKIDIKKKQKNSLTKKCERNMQEFCKSIKMLNL